MLNRQHEYWVAKFLNLVMGLSWAIEMSMVYMSKSLITESMWLGWLSFYMGMCGFLCTTPPLRWFPLHPDQPCGLIHLCFRSILLMPFLLNIWYCQSITNFAACHYSKFVCRPNLLRVLYWPLSYHRFCNFIFFLLNFASVGVCTFRVWRDRNNHQLCLF